MFERFTDRARRVVVAAQEESRLLGHDHIGSEHLLLGLLRVQDGTAAQFLGQAGVTVEAARSRVADLAGPGGEPPAGHMPFTQRAKKILELSLREALQQNKSYIGTEHILLALTRDPDGTGAHVLGLLAGPLPALRRRLLDETATVAPDPGAQQEAEHQVWARDWQYGQARTRESRVPPATVIGYRAMLAPVDRRLAGIERHLGIATGEAPAPGFRGLLDSVERRLANIERHLGAGSREAEGPAAEGPEQEEPGAEPE